MRTGGRPGSNDDGETLVELLIAMAIMGIAVVAIVGGVATSILMSDVHRKEATAGAYLRNYAEQLQGSYATCTGNTPPDYASLLTKPNSTFNVPTATVKFWTTSPPPGPAGGSFTTGCPATDLGLQQITLTLKSSGIQAAESLTVVVRQP